MDQTERAEYLIRKLLEEGGREGDIPETMDERRHMLRGLMNTRSARPVPPEVLEIQNEYLKEETERKGVADIKDLEPVKSAIYLWRGDITALRCDAVVNAAKSPMTGCITPNHSCLDNCVHTFAGMELRLECERSVRQEGFLAPGDARMTKAYNLPCRYIIHTVAPKIFGKATDEDERILENCYLSCMRLADGAGLKNLAFCCLGTGEFRFPKKEAANIAVRTVEKFRKKSPLEVVFAVYGDEDFAIYSELLS